MPIEHLSGNAPVVLLSRNEDEPFCLNEAVNLP